MRKSFQKDASMQKRLFSLMILSAGLLVSSCSSDSGSDASTQTAADAENVPTCTAGTEGCECLPGDVPCSVEGLICDTGECVDPTNECPLGQVGCGCFGNATCNVASGGAQLVCEVAVCVVPEVSGGDCPTGELGCSCYPNATCDASGTEVPVICQGQTCTAAPGQHDCPDGQLGCPCYGNGSCNIAGDGKSMACQGNVCVVPEEGPDLCPTGNLGCQCYANATC
ncbi:MAG: hypothetical protein ACI9OJ_004936, partial [Myxococcota bacterium]